MGVHGLRATQAGKCWEDLMIFFFYIIFFKKVEISDDPFCVLWKPARYTNHLSVSCLQNDYFGGSEGFRERLLLIVYYMARVRRAAVLSRCASKMM